MISTSRISSAAVVRVFTWCVVLAGLIGSTAQHSLAALFTLTDDNSVSQFDTATQANNFNWFVDGLDILAQQAFWYRVGNAGPEQSVHTLPIAVQGTSDANLDGNPDTLFVRYNGAGFRIETRYTLDGGTPGSGSDLGEQISITNLLGSPLDFHFFQYADFDLGPRDTADFTNMNTVEQFTVTNNVELRLSETVVTPAPDHREIEFFPVTLNKLNDGQPTTLSDTPDIGFERPPGDMTWAFEWDVAIPPSVTFQISKDENFHPVPEPSVLMLAVPIGLIFSRRRLGVTFSFPGLRTRPTTSPQLR